MTVSGLAWINWYYCLYKYIISVLYRFQVLQQMLDVFFFILVCRMILKPTMYFDTFMSPNSRTSPGFIFNAHCSKLNATHAFLPGDIFARGSLFLLYCRLWQLKYTPSIINSSPCQGWRVGCTKPLIYSQAQYAMHLPVVEISLLFLLL